MKEEKAPAVFNKAKWMLDFALPHIGGRSHALLPVRSKATSVFIPQ